MTVSVLSRHTLTVMHRFVISCLVMHAGFRCNMTSDARFWLWTDNCKDDKRVHLWITLNSRLMTLLLLSQMN